MENKIELKPCPFCGGAAKLEVAKHGSCQYDYAEVYCSKCYAEIRYDINVEYSAKDKAVEVWNRRAEK